jgi:putative hydrolase of the HAD superfamily
LTGLSSGAREGRKINVRFFGGELWGDANGEAQLQRAKIARFDLAYRLHDVQIEGEHGFGKPEERAYVAAMQALVVTLRRPGWSATTSNAR